MCRSWNRTSSPWSCSLGRFHPQSGPSCENTWKQNPHYGGLPIAPNIGTRSWGHSLTHYCVSIFGQVVTRVWPRLAQHSGCVYLCFWIFADLHVLCRWSDLQVRSNPWSFQNLPSSNSGTHISTWQKYFIFTSLTQISLLHYTGGQPQNILCVLEHWWVFYMAISLRVPYVRAA